jgi:hypothetical protein
MILAVEWKTIMLKNAIQGGCNGKIEIIGAGGFGIIDY